MAYTAMRGGAAAFRAVGVPRRSHPSSANTFLFRPGPSPRPVARCSVVRVGGWAGPCLALAWPGCCALGCPPSRKAAKNALAAEKPGGKKNRPKMAPNSRSKGRSSGDSNRRHVRRSRCRLWPAAKTSVGKGAHARAVKPSTEFLQRRRNRPEPRHRTNVLRRWRGKDRGQRRAIRRVHRGETPDHAGGQGTHRSTGPP
jgi:hypothetical protein